MSKIEIQNSVPVPSRSYSKGRPRKYPFPEMKAGDSFFYPGGDTSTSPAATSARGYASRYGAAFTTRSVEEDGVQGVRIWCLAPATRGPYAERTPEATTPQS